MRNPFTSFSNISFLRNNSRVSQQTRDSYTPRSLSSHKYFNYKSSYMHDKYLLEYNSRKDQENKYCGVMGLEAMRYVPEASFIENEYYAVESHFQPIASKAEDSCPTDANSKTLQSAMKNTRDMFGSDYFSHRAQGIDSEEVVPKKSSIKRKDTNGSSKIRFNKTKEVYCSQLSEQPSHLQDSFQEYRRKQIIDQPPPFIQLKGKDKRFYLYAGWSDDY